MSGTLVLVRHGQSEWNLKNLFTGVHDVGLTDKGHEEAKKAGNRLKELNLSFDRVFSSMLKRAQATCHHILNEMNQEACTPLFHDSLNERDYGDLTGLNKDEARIRWGEEQVKLWRRSYDVAPPGGESLRDVGARVWLYYLHVIQIHILRKEKVLIVAHGNSLRALIMALERLSPEEIIKVEIPTGVPFVYQINQDSTVSSKNILA